MAKFNVGGTNANVNAHQVLFTADGTIQTTAYTEPQGSKVLFVDNHRTDSFVPDGSFDRPFSLIMDAVTQVATNGDNSTDVVYVIQIAPGLYPETIDLSNTAVTNIVFQGSNGVIVGSNTMNAPVVLALNNDQLAQVFFVNMVFQLNGSAPHGIEIASGSGNTGLGKNGIIFKGCGLQDNTEDVYFNNVGFVSFDDTGITANINATNVNLIQFVNGNGPNPQTPFVITTDSGSPTPANWTGSSRAQFMNVGVGAITCDAGSDVQVTNCVISGAITTTSASGNVTIIANSFIIGSVLVNAGGTLALIECLVSQPTSGPASTLSVDGILLVTTSIITGTAITVNSGGVFVEYSSSHDDGELTVNSGGAYTTEGDLGTGSLYLSEHLNNVAGNPDLCGTLTITDGTETSFTFENAFVSAPVVVITPQGDMTALGAYWVTTSNTGFSIFMKNSGTMTFNYVVIGNPN
jgi:hypothetical protein